MEPTGIQPFGAQRNSPVTKTVKSFAVHGPNLPNSNSDSVYSNHAGLESGVEYVLQLTLGRPGTWNLPKKGYYLESWRKKATSNIGIPIIL